MGEAPPNPIICTDYSQFCCEPVPAAAGFALPRFQEGFADPGTALQLCTSFGHNLPFDLCTLSSEIPGGPRVLLSSVKPPSLKSSLSLCRALYLPPNLSHDLLTNPTLAGLPALGENRVKPNSTMKRFL